MEHGVITITTADRLAFGRAVRELRGRRGMSLSELGRATLVHEGYLGAVERAEVEPTLRTMVRVAGGLGVPLSVLVERYETRRRAADGGGRDGGA
ncbi:helix-turn-helix domain-containing protein [Conexibacter woesei]|uniref:Transcriptional regulator, XRE family n=1 Tax=Conexibacter woesei (strain DSM 14684 / CCUG 47730 / CIP 108061 / JCM 11494 / NBRC 100937 / ID131577) TaxID=469383 RepID=D3FCX1_CONWI|nr:helix-turn-helix transcriptional regulator [Conexibacter woesei]ADB51483.1 transcriptional regulator, XRE family [Conexibacter woesei DSM 14684]